MTESYPDWRKGIRRGFKWGLILSAVLTLPNLFMPQGDPAPGYSAAAVLRDELVQPAFWPNIAGIFGMFFVVIFVIATLIGAFRPS